MIASRPRGRLTRICAVSGFGLGLLVVSTPSGSLRGDPLEDEIRELEVRERFVEAFARAVARASELADSSGPLAPETLAALERTGTIAYQGGALDVAERVLERTLTLREESHGPSSIEVAESLLGRGRVARVAAERDLARASIERALAIVEPRARRHPRLYADLLAARANWLRRDDLDAAIGESERALEARLEDREARAVDVADDLTWLGWMLFHRGRHAEARVRFDEAEARLRDAGLEQHTLLGVVLSARADERAIHGDWVEAERLYRTSTAIFDAARRGYFPGFARRKSPRHGYPYLALTVLRQGRGDEAFELLERGRGAITTEFLDLARWRDVDPAGYAEAQRRRAAWLGAERASRAPDAEPERGIRLLLLALERYASVLEAEQRYLERIERPGATAARVQAALGPTEAYVGWEEITLGDEHRASSGPSLHETWAYVVRSDGVRWVPLARAEPGRPRPLERELYRYVGMVRRAASWPLRVDRDDELRALGAELARVLVEPVVPHLAGVDRLIIELSDLVPFLPVESLALADGTCLKQRFAVSYSPSASAYLGWKETSRWADLTARPALAIGDPRLPYARGEVESVAALFPSATVLRGPAASEAELERLAVADRLREFGVVHLAAHMISPWHHERAALRLADGLVELPEILAGWRLDADLVTLSGCRSMTGRVFPERGEYLGFPQALFAVGARAVVASTWEVDDEAAALLMRRFYENLTGQPGMSPGQALREAGLWLRDYEDEGGARPFEHPVYWSGFILLGAPE